MRLKGLSIKCSASYVYQLYKRCSTENKKKKYFPSNSRKKFPSSFPGCSCGRRDQNEEISPNFPNFPHFQNPTDFFLPAPHSPRICIESPSISPDPIHIKIKSKLHEPRHYKIPIIPMVDVSLSQFRIIFFSLTAKYSGSMYLRCGYLFACQIAMIYERADQIAFSRSSC